MDRITMLPDEVRSHILSFVPTIEAVCTSILSSKWKNTWAHASNLDFDVTPKLPQNGDPPLHIFLDFMDFVYMVLDRLKSQTVEKFRLICKHEFSTGRIAEWISEASQLSALEIEVVVHCMELPMNFFFCDRLTTLRLTSSRCGFVQVPIGFSFPNLKSLVFEVNDPPNELTKKLFRSCPILEDLTIGGGTYHGTLIYDITSPLLKKLNIVLRGHYTSRGPLPRVILDVPILECLEIDDGFGAYYLVRNLLSTVNASIRIGWCCYYWSDQDDGDYALGLLRGVSGAKSLLLAPATVVLMENFVDHVHSFQFLTCLEVEIPRTCHWTFFDGLLNSSPYLKFLTIKKVCDHYTEFADPIPDVNFDEWRAPIRVPYCLLSHLEVFNFFGHFWGEHDMEVMKYLLENACVLKLFTIRSYSVGITDNASFWEELWDSRRASRNCQISIEDTV